MWAVGRGCTLGLRHWLLAGSAEPEESEMATASTTREDTTCTLVFSCEVHINSDRGLVQPLL